ncbi:photosynthetic reaction center cytochrome PufC [Jannaschia aquimarina]|uniref:Photosynthetic reaction center cytochrome c subunit n=1 Tax=Jannaschia aquimarina TaxID=935700 RepID=A0A0D1EAY6_9RHOB|nr:photosynthetic reaction center cytochrome PufC [Jannaschia aquimarina]KIT14899.1 Photosynthetic reaction center cytochrome c subunit precursor [Jannaschia aquimarina]SNS58792.1 photosynthetic reaction center cytochrome c subunit [Jannaschia aquimarina]
MLPKWFNDWNNGNPTNIFGPAILVGALGAAVFVAAMLVTWGQPYQLTSIQTGPPGIGMAVVERENRPADPTIDEYYTEAPYAPEPGEPLAGEVYENVQVLGDVTEANFLRLMNAITLWVAPEEGCAYCHAGADEGIYADDSLYTKVVGRRMIQMTQVINEEWDAHVNYNAQVGVNCYTCHRGQNVPSEIWFRIDPTVEVMEGWGGVQNLVTPQSQFTSLPSDALYRYLYEDNRITVHDLASRVGDVPSDPMSPTWQDTERTYSLMNYFSNSLGVNCVFCHNSRAFYDPTQFTPQWANASLAIEMVRDLNNLHLEPLRDVYPPERLGPIYADAPKGACKTCHKGYNKPMQGLNVIADWPELATTGEPDYSAVTQ